MPERTKLVAPAKKMTLPIPSNAIVVFAIPDTGGWGLAVGAVVEVGGTQVTPGAGVPSQIGPNVGACASAEVLYPKRKKIVIRKVTKSLKRI